MDTEKIWEAVIAVLLATAGCLARLLHKKKPFKLSQMFSEVFISGFAGYMILLVFRLMGLKGDWLGLVCGMAGWMGPRVLDVIAEVVTKRIEDSKN